MHVDGIHISGIYNYCDRWCERCQCTSRCPIFANEMSLRPRGSDDDEQNAESAIKDVAVSLQQALQMLENIARKEQIELTQRDFNSATVEVWGQRYRARSDLLVITARDYCQQTSAWFAKHQDVLERTLRDLVIDSGPPRIDTSDQATAQGLDALEVINWYQLLIATKIERAVLGRIEAQDPADEFSEADANGSMKVALIGIDRSVTAWRAIANILGHVVPDLESPLVLLEQLRQDCERSFPGARNFIRPGFDQEAN